MRERENLPVLTFDDRRMSTLLVHTLSRSTNNAVITRPVYLTIHGTSANIRCDGVQ